MGAVQLSHDVIDSQLVDRHQEKIGRIDELLIELDVEGNTLESLRLERWLSEHVIGRIPGASGERK